MKNTPNLIKNEIKSEIALYNSRNGAFPHFATMEIFLIFFKHTIINNLAKEFAQFVCLNNWIFMKFLNIVFYFFRL